MPANIKKQTSAPTRNKTDIIQTASVTALFRALMASENGLRKNPDYLAKYFVNDSWSEFLKEPCKSRINLEKRLPGGIYYHLIRTLYFDNSLIRWLNKYPKSQIVFLGAGFDTRSIRFFDIMKNSKIFEVDLKAMLEYKTNIINDYSLENNNKNKKYVAIDFHTENTIDKLLDSGFDPKIPSYYLMEGITFFLEKSTVINIFKNLICDSVVKTCAAFDYVFEDYVNGDLNYYGATEMSRELTKLGEPHLFGLDYSSVDSFFENSGCTTQNNYTALMLEALYLTNKEGESVGRPHTFFGITEITN